MVKEVMVLNPQELKLVLGGLSWKILNMLSEREMYPLQIARELKIREQKVYYHIKKLAKAGAITAVRQEGRRGVRYYRAVAPAFAVELPYGYRSAERAMPAWVSESLRKFFGEFLREDGVFDGKIVVGSPLPHGPFRTSARDGHYASHLAFFLGQFARMPKDFTVKLDVDVKAEKDEKNNLILIGGPGTNLLTQDLNDYLPIKFNIQPSEHGFLFGGLFSAKTGHVYTADSIGLVAKIINPWDPTKRVIILAGNKAVGTKACVLALTSFWEKTLKNYREEPFATVIQGLDLDGDGKVDSIEILE
jgi:DNA-binding transcriptional ArsR family regulator